MEINKLTSTNDRASNLREADGKQKAQQSGDVGQDNSTRTQSSEPSDNVNIKTNVQLSAAAQVLAEATESANNASDVDLGRVQEIRSAIEQGTYHVDPERLAANFVGLERQLFG